MADVVGTAKVRVDGADASQELNKLEKQAVELKKQLVELKKQDLLDNKKIKDVQSQLTAVNKEIKSVKDQTVSYQTVLKNLSGASLKELQKAYKQLYNETVKLDRSTSEFKNNAANLKKLESAITGVRKEMKGAGESAKGFSFDLKGIGSQLLGAAGIVGGVDMLVTGAKEYIKASKEMADINRKLQTSFELTNDEAHNAAVTIKSVADTFDQDYNEVMIAATTVSKEMGISVNDAAKMIEDGFLKGSNNSGQFLDILKEYPTQFDAAGISADQMFAIINKQVTDGIYSDKGVDAIKEAGLRLRENTKAVQDALAPLDESIRMQIQQEVAAGNSFKAIQLVSKALSDSNLTAQQTQAIIADVFGGAGEDAGLKYLQTLKDIDTNMNNVAIQASSSEQGTLNLSKAWNNLIGSVDGSESVFSRVWGGFKDALAGAINGVWFAIQKIGDLKDKVVEFLGFRYPDSAGKKMKETGQISDELVGKFKGQKKAVLELTDAEKKAASERKKALEEILKANKDLLDFITSSNIQRIEDDKARAYAEVEQWAKKESDKIEASKASETIKNEAIETLEALHKQKLEAIDKKYADEQIKSYQSILDFIAAKQVELDSMSPLQGQIDKINAQYEAQIQKLVEMGDKETEINELKRLKNEEINNLLIENTATTEQQIFDLKQQYGLLTEEEIMNAELKAFETSEFAKTLTTEEQEKARKFIRDKYQKDEKKAMEDKVKVYTDFAVQAGDIFAQAFADGNFTAKEAMKNFLIMSLDMLKRFVQMKVAEATAASLASADSIATFGAAGLAKAAILAGLIEASFGLVKGIVSGFEDGGEIPVTRAQDGKQFRARYRPNQRGYVDKPTVLVGEYGKREFVVSNRSLQVPAIQRAVSAIDAYQSNRSPQYFNYEKVNSALSNVRGFADGGTFGTTNTGTTTTPVQSNAEAISVALLNEFIAFRQDIATWQSSLEVYVEIQKIRDAESDLSTLEAKVRL